MVLLDPTMTVRVNVAVELAPLNVSWSAHGAVWNVKTTVFGSSRSALVFVRPPESVAVRLSSRYDGYSWSGAVNDPLLTPGNCCRMWEWQLDGQCWRTSCHVSALAGRVPSWASVAVPEELMTSPTFHVVPAAGDTMVAVGGVLPTAMATESVSEAPCGSVTRNEAVYEPAAVYVNVAVEPVPSS